MLNDFVSRKKIVLVFILKSFYIIVSIFWIYIIYVSLAMAMPFNPSTISDDFKFRMNLKSIFPQGWGFFTRDPREADLILYEYQNKTWKKSTSFPYSAPKNLFGITRGARAMSTEIPLLLNQLEVPFWDTCYVDPKICMESYLLTKTKVTSVTLDFSQPIIKDTICIVMVDPIPWAWSDLNLQIEREFKYVVLNVN